MSDADRPTNRTWRSDTDPGRNRYETTLTGKSVAILIVIALMAGFGAGTVASLILDDDDSSNQAGNVNSRQVDRLQSTVDRLTDQVNDLRGNLTSTQTAVQNLDRRVTSRDSQLQETNSNLRQLQGEVDELSSTVNQLESDLGQSTP